MKSRKNRSKKTKMKKANERKAKASKVKTPKLFSLIKADHRKFEELFAKVQKTTDRGLKTREKLYADLRSEIKNHSDAEEKAVYPRLKEHPETEEMGYQNVEDHAVVKSLLSKLDSTPCESKEWIARINVLDEAIRHHVEEEEGTMFKKMQKVFSEEELGKIEIDFQKAKQGFLERLGEIISGEEKFPPAEAA